MKGKREHLDYIKDMLDAVENINDFIEGMDFESFANDEKTSFAVVRALEIIGEAAKKVPPEIKTANPELPWREMAGLRDKLIHDYIGVDLEVVWKTVTEDIPGLRTELQSIYDRG